MFICTLSGYSSPERVKVVSEASLTIFACASNYAILLDALFIKK